MKAAALSALCLALAAPGTAAPAARKPPDFVPRAQIYQVWPRSFTPEGTLAAARQRLAHIAALGATVVYLCPIMRQSTAGGITNPYRISDYGAIDPEYGTEADLRSFVAEAHRRGLRVILDVVFYHAAADNPLMKPPASHVCDAHGQPVLSTWNTLIVNFGDAAVRRYLVGNLVHWVRDVDVDGFRCDVASRVPLDFWEQARAELNRTGKEVLMLAEGDTPAFHLKAFDVSYDYPYYQAVVSVVRDGRPASSIREQWEKTRARYPAGTLRLRFNDNHDQDRADVIFGRKAALATSILNFTMDGVPLLYNGQEIGDTTPRFHDRPFPWERGAAVQTAIRWELGKFQPSARVCGHVPLAAQQEQRFREFQQLFALRAREKALTAGSLVWVDNNQPESVLSYLRTTPDEEVLVVVNLSNRRCPVELQLPADKYRLMRPLLKIEGAASTAPSAGRLACALGAFGFSVEKRVR